MSLLIIRYTSKIDLAEFVAQKEQQMSVLDEQINEMVGKKESILEELKALLDK